MALHGNEDTVRIPGIDDNCRDLLGVAEAKMRPRFSSVNGLIKTIADRKVRPLQAFAASDIKNVWIGRSDGQRADGTGGLLIENREPRIAKVGSLPHAAVHRGHVKDIGLLRNAADGHGASAAKRPDTAPAHFGIKFRIVLLRANGNN